MQNHAILIYKGLHTGMNKSGLSREFDYFLFFILFYNFSFKREIQEEK